MSYKILPLMNSSKSNIPLYTNISKTEPSGPNYSTFELGTDNNVNNFTVTRTPVPQQNRVHSTKNSVVYNLVDDIYSHTNYSNMPKSIVYPNETSSVLSELQEKSQTNDKNSHTEKRFFLPDESKIWHKHIKESQENISKIREVGKENNKYSYIKNNSLSISSIKSNKYPLNNKKFIDHNVVESFDIESNSRKKSSHDKNSSYNNSQKNIKNSLNHNNNCINVYSKGLPHDNEGFVNHNEINKLISALKSNNSKKLSQVNLGGNIKLANPSSIWTNGIIDIYCDKRSINKYFWSCDLNSDLVASEMSELYCMSLVRDIPFRKYDVSTIIEDCCNYLNSLKTYPQVTGKINPNNIFRGQTEGNLLGPYISQFLYYDIKTDISQQKQKYYTYLEGYDFMKSWKTTISAQNGIIMEALPPKRLYPRYIITGRDLSSFVYNNNIIIIFCNIYDILINFEVPMNRQIQNLFNNNLVENYTVDFGKIEIQSILNVIGKKALLAANYIKWNTLFLRPEALGIEVERVFRDGHNKYCISDELLRNPVLNAVRSLNGNVLLSQVYCEGSSLSPSMPSEQAAISGACSTILKFFFDIEHELDVYEPDVDGNNLINTQMKTTVKNELDKLAYNLGFGTIWSGTQYHIDIIKGLKLGERIAIYHLRDIIKKYPAKLNVAFNKFNGKIITIKN